MTCIEKLKEIRPHLTDSDVREYIRLTCPHSFDIMATPDWCDSTRCDACWNREVSEDIPREFEYQFNEYYKAHITVLERHDHRYQGYVIYKVYREIEDGSFGVKWFSEVEMRNMLKMRIE